ncbi:MAG TPA: S1 RNA-binding domain-containing protein [Pirellulaceae bacterium]|nr:S1 RNA-binding domain-containing protein [Pirellulaceae bacterium]HMO92930.1 S1 RNA-binding domain-containing protein [Pirellulaceae bacterium]HMP71049.1 S1 RNA-binding domain-containing protein [Pirellulaceae bacterium]
MNSEPNTNQDANVNPDQDTQEVDSITSGQKPKRKILIGSQLDDDAASVIQVGTKPRAVENSTGNDSSQESPPQPNLVHSENSENGGAQKLPDGTSENNSNIAPNLPESSNQEAIIPVASSAPIVNYELPSRANIDAEVDRIMSGISIDTLVEGATPAAELELDSRVKGTVDRVHGDSVFFNLKGRFVGIASLRSFKEPPHPGAMLDVQIRSFNQEDGFYEVTVPGAAIDVADWSDLTPGAIVDAKITGSNTGGLECMVNGIRGFIPASQIEIFRVENFADYINQKLQCVVTEANPSKKKLVLSHRSIVEKEREELKKEKIASLEAGQILDGTVIKLMDFGAFVDIGGIEGMIHVSKLAWERINHPREVLNVSDKISVKIEKVNSQTGKISLSYRDTQEHPWKRAAEKYPVDATCSGVVSKLAQFGAFVKLEPGIEGLVHISEIAHHRVVAVKTHLNVGDQVNVKVLSIDPDAQKIGLSIKALIDKPIEPEKTAAPEVDEPVRESVVPKKHKPLEGGTRRKTGGEEFGLKW